MQKLLGISILTLSLASAIGGCQKSDKPSANESASEKKEAIAEATPTITPASESKRPGNSESNNAQKNIPLTDYIAVDASDESKIWLTYTAIAQSDRHLTDDELLNTFSGKYHNEQDAFKKREIASLELPKIKESIEKHKSQKHYSIPFNPPSLIGNGPHLLLSSYNFDEKAFEVDGSICSAPSSISFFAGSTITNRQGAQLTLEAEDKNICNLRIEDTELAKTIESLRAKNNANLQGTLYFQIKNVDNGNHIKAIVRHIKYEIYDDPHYNKDRKLIATYSY